MTDKKQETGAKGPATKAAHAGRRAEWTGAVVNPPVWRASTHLYAKYADLKAANKSNADGGFFYGRRGGPTQWALAQALNDIEPGAHGTMLYPSGVAAIAGCMLSVLKPGDHLLVTDNAYDPTRSMARGLLARMGITHSFFDPLDLPAFAALLDQHNPRAVWLESPGSLTMDVCDIPALTAAARAAGTVSILDNTWASALGFAGLSHGCDIVMQSLSKHVGGHSDLMMGAASAGERWYRALRRTSQQLGQVVSPDDAALAMRGLRTMPMRLQHTTSSAAAIAEWLAQQPQVSQVMCPMLLSDPGHAIWSRDFTGGCGLFSFVLSSAHSGDQSGYDGASHLAGRFVDALELFGIGYSWGGFESLSLPIFPHDYRAVMTSPTAPDISDDTGTRAAIRLSIGIEDTEDLIADLAQALRKLDN